MKDSTPRRGWTEIFDEDAPGEPHYDPLHIASVLIACQIVAGALFWLMWTLLVYEGGLPNKVMPFLRIMTGGRTLADYGWLGSPDREGIFEGWLANLAALAITALVIAALYRLERRRAVRPSR